ncbi:MAG: pilus assembly FimT family protein [Candidatus Xenobia bacterium]
MRRARGISLIEIVVAMLIAGILLAVGIPLLHRNQTSQTVKAAADSIISALNRMRSGQVSRLLLDPSQMMATLDVSGDSANPSGVGGGSNPNNGGSGTNGTNGVGGGSGTNGINGTGSGPNPSASGAQTGPQPTISSSNVHCNLWVINSGNGNIASRVSLDPNVLVTINNGEGTQIDNSDSTAVVFIPLGRAIAWQPSGHLDPTLPVKSLPSIQVSDGPVVNGAVQGAAGVEIDLTTAGSFTVHQLPSQ